MKQTHDLIQDLSKEHVAIKSILNVITKIVENTNSKQNYNVKDVEEIIDFIDCFIVKNHYCKEELLFHSLLNTAKSADIELFESLTHDHKNETAIVKAIIVALDKCKSISPGSSQVIIENFKTYVKMLQAHINMEDSTIYPIINNLLTEQLQDELIVQFENIQQKVFKNVTFEQYEQFTLKLEEKYLLKVELIFF